MTYYQCICGELVRSDELHDCTAASYVMVGDEGTITVVAITPALTLAPSATETGDD